MRYPHETISRKWSSTEYRAKKTIPRSMVAITAKQPAMMMKSVAHATTIPSSFRVPDLRLAFAALGFLFSPVESLATDLVLAPRLTGLLVWTWVLDAEDDVAQAFDETHRAEDVQLDPRDQRDVEVERQPTRREDHVEGDRQAAVHDVPDDEDRQRPAHDEAELPHASQRLVHGAMEVVPVQRHGRERHEEDRVEHVVNDRDTDAHRGVMLQLRVLQVLAEDVQRHQEQRAVQDPEEAGRQQHRVRERVHGHAALVLLELIRQELETEGAEDDPCDERRRHEEGVARVSVQIPEAVVGAGIGVRQSRHCEGRQVRARALHRVLKHIMHLAAVRGPGAIVQEHAGVQLIRRDGRPVAVRRPDVRALEVHRDRQDQRLLQVRHGRVRHGGNALLLLVGANEGVADFTGGDRSEVEDQLLDPAHNLESLVNGALEGRCIREMDMLDVDIIRGSTIDDGTDGARARIEREARLGNDVEAAVGLGLERRYREILAHHVDEDVIRFGRAAWDATVRAAHEKREVVHELERAGVKLGHNVRGVQQRSAYRVVGHVTF
eukprot:scaffold1661_cov251-Pinguiococcus_pyrenoidosus.AAC.19